MRTALALLVVGLATPALAHKAPKGWNYPIVCCSNRDCGQIPASSVQITSEGYAVTLQPGMHDFITPATGPKSYVIPYSRARVSPDGEFHICIRPADLQLLCFFAPPPGA